MLIDFHVNFYDEPGYGEALAETARNLGFDRLCIGGGDARYGLAANAEVRRQADDYPELFVPFAHVDPGRESAATVERLYRIGFAGLRLWAPPAPYDDERFFGVYETAQALGMPVVFHTGFLPRTPLDRARRVRSANMRPVYLDSLARWFPDLQMVGVGLGCPWFEEAAETLRYHENVYFDLSGDVLRRKGADFFQSIFRSEQTSLWEENTGGNMWDRILFGSAGRHEEIAAAERNYQRVLRSLAADGREVDAVMGNTAARLLGIPVQSPQTAE